MPELTPHIVDEVVAACRSGAAEAAATIHRELGASVSLHVQSPGSFQTNALSGDLIGPGLVVVFSVGSVGALLTIPETGGLVPPWCAEPDTTGQSRLATLAQELGILLLPESLVVQDSKCERVKNLAGALACGGVGEGAVVLPLELSVGGQPRGTACLIWPVPKPNLVLATAGEKPASPEPAPPGPTSAAPRTRTPSPAADPRPERLPAYTRSLLRIRVPVIVTLAEKRQPLGKVVEMSTGSIIQFDKSCEEMLDLSVGSQRIACGEAVKVGDKFGLRITSIVLPDERFQPVKPRQKSA